MVRYSWCCAASDGYYYYGESIKGMNGIVGNNPECVTSYLVELIRHVVNLFCGCTPNNV